MKFQKRTVFIDAIQWFKQGDHPKVGLCGAKPGITQGQAKRLGWLDTPQGGHAVYPGDWVILDQKGNLSTCNPISFKKIYEPAEPYLDIPLPRGHGEFEA